MLPLKAWWMLQCNNNYMVWWYIVIFWPLQKYFRPIEHLSSYTTEGSSTTSGLTGKVCLPVSNFLKLVYHVYSKLSIGVSISGKAIYGIILLRSRLDSINLQTPIIYPSVAFFSICIVTIMYLSTSLPDRGYIVHHRYCILSRGHCAPLRQVV